VIGWKHHPEEIHVTPAGGLVLPTPRRHALSLQPLLMSGPDDQPVLLSPEKVRQRLVGGYMPGVISEWKETNLTVQQLAFGSLLEGDQVLTGREVLLGLSRFTLRNDSDQRVKGSFGIRIGEGARHQSMRKYHPVYPGKLSYADSVVREENGEAAVCVVKNTLGEISFTHAERVKRPSDHLVLNEQLASIAKPELEIDFERKDGALAIGGRPWPRGVDLYVEMSPGHSSSAAAQVEVVAAGEKRVAGWLGRSGLVAENKIRPEVYLAGGECSGPLSWSVLQKLLPEGPGQTH
jgi:hypothetical protein